MKDNFVKFYWGKLKSFLYLAAFVLLLASCSLDDDRNATDPIPVAYVSIYHASPNAPELDIYVDERPVNRLEFTDYTGYLNFYTGDRHFKVNPFNASRVSLSKTLSFRIFLRLSP